MGVSIRDEYATMRFSPPSSSLTLDEQTSATKARTSRGTSIPFSFTILSRMAILVSSTGDCMSAIRPDSKRVISLSLSEGISFGRRSHASMICFPSSTSSLNRWKISSWVSSRPAMNWRSSSRRVSVFRYSSLNLSTCPSEIASISSDSKTSMEVYTTLALESFAWMRLPIAWSRCVFPSPDRLYMKSGL